MPLTVTGENYREFSEPRFFECETTAQVEQIRNPVDKSHALVAATDGSTNLTVWKFDTTSTDAASATVLVPTNPAFAAAGRWISLGATGSGGGGGGAKRVVVLTDAATVTVNSATTDVGDLLTLSQATQFLNPTGTPNDAQAFVIRINSTTARALTWDTQFRAGLYLPLPTTTSGSSLTDYFGFIWNAHSSTWDFAANLPGY